MDIKEYTRRVKRLLKTVDFMKLVAMNDMQGQEKRYVNKALTECLSMCNRKARGVYNKSEELKNWLMTHAPIINNDTIFTLGLLELELGAYLRFFSEEKD